MKRNEIELPKPTRRERPGHPYRCGRPVGDASCEDGPTALGRCPLAGRCRDAGESGADSSRCRPRRNWSGRRKQLVVGALLIFSVVLVLAFGTPVAPHIAKPGELSTPHAQILAGTLTQQRCTACHENISTSTWFSMADAGHQGQSIPSSMTDRCVACHHSLTPRHSSKWAHNLPAQTRTSIRLAAAAARARASKAKGVRDVGGGKADWLTTLTSLPSPAISQDDVSCSVCHQEHHGADADLLAIADRRCQTCHSNQFGSFPEKHPEFANWPEFTTNALAFDHARHAELHFPKHAASSSNAGSSESQSAFSFDCKQCHVRPIKTGDTSDPVIATHPFEVACASCHDESLVVQTAKGPSLLSLPTLPEQLAQQLPSWPESATGMADGKLTGWLPLLLRSARPNLPTHRFHDFANVDWSNPAVSSDATQVALAIRQLAIDLAVGGQPYLAKLLMDAGVPSTTANQAARSFSPQLMRQAVEAWFLPPNESNATSLADVGNQRNDLGTNANGDGLLNDSLFGQDRALLGDDALLADTLLEDDALANDPLDQSDSLESFASDDALLLGGGEPLSDPLAAEATSGELAWQDELRSRYDAAKVQPLGGWFLDEVTLNLTYRGAGHQDAVLKALIETAGRLSIGDPLRRDLLGHGAVKACLECHPGSVDQIGLAICESAWRASPVKSPSKRLTRFTHQPHLNIRGLQDCRHCHELHSLPSEPGSLARVQRERTLTGSINQVSRMLSVIDGVSADPEPPHAGQTPSLERTHSDFSPLEKAACASCHTASAAGNHCTTCHRYHVGSAELSLGN